MAQVLMIGHSVLMSLSIHFISAPKIDIFYELSCSKTKFMSDLFSLITRLIRYDH